MTSRRFPRWADLRPYLQVEPIRGSAVDRRLARAASIEDLRLVARRHTPRAVFDYVDGAAETELSLRRSRAAFEAVEFVPSAPGHPASALPGAGCLPYGHLLAVRVAAVRTGFDDQHVNGAPRPLACS